MHQGTPLLFVILLVKWTLPVVMSPLTEEEMKHCMSRMLSFSVQHILSLSSSLPLPLYLPPSLCLYIFHPSISPSTPLFLPLLLFVPVSHLAYGCHALNVCELCGAEKIWRQNRMTKQKDKTKKSIQCPHTGKRTCFHILTSSTPKLKSIICPCSELCYTGFKTA